MKGAGTARPRFRSATVQRSTGTRPSPTLAKDFMNTRCRRDELLRVPNSPLSTINSQLPSRPRITGRGHGPGPASRRGDPGTNPIASRGRVAPRPPAARPAGTEQRPLAAEKLAAPEDAPPRGVEDMGPEWAHKPPAADTLEALAPPPAAAAAVQWKCAPTSLLGRRWPTLSPRPALPDRVMCSFS